MNKIKMYVTRDKLDTVELWLTKPDKTMNGGYFLHGKQMGILPSDSFPEVTLENSPVEAELTL